MSKTTISMLLGATFVSFCWAARIVENKNHEASFCIGAVFVGLGCVMILLRETLDVWDK